MDVTGISYGTNVVHLATDARTFFWDAPQYVRTCNINAGNSTSFLQDVLERDASEITCRSCKKIARSLGTPA